MLKAKALHRILFDNATSDWNEGLPMGNGVLGCMSYYRNQQLTMAFNHYDVYYASLPKYSARYRDQLKNGQVDFSANRPTLSEYRKIAQSTLEKGWNLKEHQPYQRVIWPPKTDSSMPMPAAKQNGTSHPPSGEVVFCLSERFSDPKDFSLSLEIEKATTYFKAVSGGYSIKTSGVVLQDEDAYLCNVSQSAVGNIKEILFTYPQRRNHKGYNIEFTEIDNKTFLCEVSFYLPGDEPRPEEIANPPYEPFYISCLMQLKGASAHSTSVEKTTISNENPDVNNLLKITLSESQTSEEFSIVYAVSVGKGSKDELLVRCSKVLDKQKEYLAHHQTHWNDFFNKSTVSLPDKFLEKLWFYNLYILGCSNRLGTKHFEQASGLNGLWDIRQPTIWGSMWYWDVNIQSTFWPVFTANHLELAKVFCDGFLEHLKMAEKRAHEYYNMSGYAMDYPHPFYNCMGPWCAQFLWWYFEYSGDVEFLRTKAYPVFQKQIDFISLFAEFDDNSGEYYFFPDVSPEQGPITKNSVITVSCVRFVLESAIKAGNILSVSEDEVLRYQDFLEKLPSYVTDQAGVYGEIWRDSAFAPPQIDLRHPSVIMPIFPAGEINRYSSKKEIAIANNTLDFAIDHTELGVFGFGWLASAAARMGRGKDALRILYEKGLDLVLRANGMGAEETDRWLNYCCVSKPPYYYPFMMECVGGILSVVNEMLLQSTDGIIEVFPAIPHDTERQETRNTDKDFSSAVMASNFPKVDYPGWKNCQFSHMLAKGGFEVSAKMTDGTVVFIEIRSASNNKAQISCPENWQSDLMVFVCSHVDGESQYLPLDNTGYTIESEILTLPTTAGGTYIVCQNHEGLSSYITETQDDISYESIDFRDVFVHDSHLSRRIFVGKDRNTDAIKHFEGAFRDYYIANQRCRNLPVYLFSFGDGTIPPLKRESSDDYILEWSSISRFIQIAPTDIFTTYTGFGFEENTGVKNLTAISAKSPDVLRDNAIKGTLPTKFCVELPKGRYDIVVVLGAASNSENSHTIIKDANDTIVADKKLHAGSFYSAVLPINLVEDGVTTVTFETTPDNNWIVNLMVVRKYAAFM